MEDENESEICEQCMSVMTRVLTADGRFLLTCQECHGEAQTGGDYTNLVDREEYEGGTTYAHDNHGPVLKGFRHNVDKKKLSEGRQAGIDILRNLCSRFQISRAMREEMEEIFQKVYCRGLEAAAGAVFLMVTRLHYTEQDLSRKLTLKQISNFTEVSMPQIGKAMKAVEKVMGGQRGNGAITKATDAVRYLLPDALQFVDPFTGEDATERVKMLTAAIIEFIGKLTNQSLQPSNITLAAGCLAWQSCFFYQKAHHGHLSVHSLKDPGPMPTVMNFLNHANLHGDSTLRDGVRRSYTLILTEMERVLGKMPWIRREGKVQLKRLLPQRLEEILQYQNTTRGLLLAEDAAKRRNEPVAHPVIPRELTEEEKKALESPELSEKDFPDDELKQYLVRNMDLKCKEKLWEESQRKMDEKKRKRKELTVERQTLKKSKRLELRQRSKEESTSNADESSTDELPTDADDSTTQGLPLYDDVDY